MMWLMLSNSPNDESSVNTQGRLLSQQQNVVK